MPHVGRDHIETEMQGCGPDNQVFHSDGNTPGRLLAFDAPGKLGDSQRQRMHDQVMEDALDEDAPPVAVGVGPGAVDAVVSSTALTAESATSVSPCAPRTLRRISSTPSPRRSLSIRMLVSRIRPKVSVPCRRIAGLAVADDLFQIGGESGVHHRLVAQLFRCAPRPARWTRRWTGAAVPPRGEPLPDACRSR